MKSIDDVIKSSSVIIHPGRYAYVKTTDKVLNRHFLISQDADEITVITEEQMLPEVTALEVVKWFKLIEIKVSVPFLQGFLSRVIKPVADAGYNTLIVSTFSKDYILTKEDNIREVKRILKSMGFKIRD